MICMYPMKTNAHEDCQNAIFKIIQQIKESCLLDVLLISTPAKPKTTHSQENSF